MNSKKKQDLLGCGLMLMGIVLAYGGWLVVGMILGLGGMTFIMFDDMDLFAKEEEETEEEEL